MAITAVLSPLLILFGLKYGLIKIYTTSLIQDPKNRELRPLSSRSYSKNWFEKMKQRQDVAFIIPNTRQLSATVIARVKDKEEKEELELIPTSDNDPLILENGASIPGQDECVLTQFAAEALQAEAGDTIVATASRIKENKFEYGSMELKVTGILSLRASTRKLMYVRLDILEAVESYKDGRAVPELGWPGSIPKAYPQYNGLVVVVPEKLDEIKKRSLAVNTGFTRIEEWDNKKLFSKAGFQISSEMTIYFLSTAKKPVGEQSIKNIWKKLRGQNAYLFPYVSPIEAQLFNASEEELASLNLYALSVDHEKIEEIGITPVPEWGEIQKSTDELLKVMLSPGSLANELHPPTPLKGGILMRVPNGDEFLTFPVSVVSEQSPVDNVAFIPAKLAGILKLSQNRNLHYDEHVEEFVLFRRGYASFRMYARTIYDVDGLRRFFEDLSLPVHTAAEKIRKVIQLTTYLDLVFWLITAVGVSGTVATLIASLYASVERKKRELGVLRLIGLSGAALFRFPIYQGVLIGTGGILVAMILFKVFSIVINTLFRPHVERLLGFSLSLLEIEQNLCQIPFLYIVGAILGTIIIAACAATVAALRVTRIEPAEALRDE